MKKLFALLLAAMLCLPACAAGNTEEPDASAPAPAAPAAPVPVSQPVSREMPEPEPVWMAAEGVAFSLLQDTYPVGTASITLVAENRSGREVEWGTWEFYEKFVDGQWRKLEYPDGLAFTDEALLLGPQSVRTQTLSALGMLPPLDEGVYRVSGSGVRVDGAEMGEWQVSFRVAADAQPEPDYALYVSSEDIPAVKGCIVTDRIPAFFVNTTGEEAEVLLIPHLERLDENGEWAEVPFKEKIGFCGTPDPLPPEGKEWGWEISALWGGLEDGRYRVGVKCQPYLDEEEMVYGEFGFYTPENSAGLPLAPRD